MPRSAAVDLVRKHIASVAERMRITEVSARPYVTDEVLKALAHDVAFVLVDESPGAEVLNAPRIAEIAVETASRTITALAEAIQVRLLGSHDVDGIRAEVAPLAQAGSALGQLLG